MRLKATIWLEDLAKCMLPQKQGDKHLKFSSLNNFQVYFIYQHFAGIPLRGSQDLVQGNLMGQLQKLRPRITASVG